MPCRLLLSSRFVTRASVCLQEPTEPQLVRSVPTAPTGTSSSKSNKRRMASRLADGLAALKERLPRWTKH